VSVVPLRATLADAFDQRYGVPAIDIVNDLTPEAVPAAAEERRSPLIARTSVKTVKPVGYGVLVAMRRAMADVVEPAGSLTDGFGSTGRAG